MLNETWLAVKLKASKQQLQVVLIDFKVKMIFGSPHAILNNHHHIFRRLKSNLKCFFIGKIHCVECCRSKWIITRYEQRSFVVASFLASTFLGINGPRWWEAFPTSRIFRTMVSFLSTQFRHKMFVESEPSPRRWIYISFPVINSRFKQALVFFWPPDIVNFRLKSLLVIILVQSKQI